MSTSHNEQLHNCRMYVDLLMCVYNWVLSFFRSTHCLKCLGMVMYYELYLFQQHNYSVLFYNVLYPPHNCAESRSVYIFRKCGRISYEKHVLGC